jgi:hypothetical protein
VTNTTHYGGERFDADEWTTDVFVLRNGRWQCVLSQITPAAAVLTAGIVDRPVPAPPCATSHRPAGFEDAIPGAGSTPFVT